MDGHGSLVNVCFKQLSIDGRACLQKEGLAYTVSFQTEEPASEAGIAFFKGVGMEFKSCSGYLMLSGRYVERRVLTEGIGYIFSRMETAYGLLLEFSGFKDPLPFREAFPYIMYFRP